MVHADGGALARRIVSLSRVLAGLAMTTYVVASCADHDHPPFASCRLPDAAATRTDAGPDAGDAAIVGCGTPTRMIVGGGTPPGGPPSGTSGGTSVGNAGTGVGAGGSAGFGNGDGGFSSGFAGTGAGFGGTLPPGFAGTATGFAGSPTGSAGTPMGVGIGGVGVPGIGGIPF